MQLTLFNFDQIGVLFIYDTYRSIEDSFECLKFIARPTLYKNIYLGVNSKDNTDIRLFKRVSKVQFRYIY